MCSYCFETLNKGEEFRKNAPFPKLDINFIIRANDNFELYFRKLFSYKFPLYLDIDDEFYKKIILTSCYLMLFW